MSPLTELLLEQLSFTGMRDSRDPPTADPRKAFLLQNVYPQDEVFGGGTNDGGHFLGRAGDDVGSSRTKQF